MHDREIWFQWPFSLSHLSHLQPSQLRNRHWKLQKKATQQRPIQWTRIAVRFTSKSRSGKPTEKGNDYGTTVPFVGDWPQKLENHLGFGWFGPVPKHIFKIEAIWTCVCVIHLAGVTGDASSQASPGCKQSYLQGTGYNNLVSSGWKFVARNWYFFPYQ